MSTVRLTTSQALVRWLASQWVETPAGPERLCAGVWAIFGHGNVAGLGEALAQAGDDLPTWRGHNEQAMALAAVAYAKAKRRRRFMAVTSSIGPGATNMVTAAAVAHVNRLPLLLLPGDVFASRRPDPVLQQVEDFADGTVSANDCFRPVSRYWDRIARPEQLLAALPRAFAILTDPAACGPVTLCLCQDTQTEAFDWPESFFASRVWTTRKARPDRTELAAAAALLAGAKAPLVTAGGGVLYADADLGLADFAARHGVPVAETQAGKGALNDAHPMAVGSIGVTGTSAANALAAEADLILAVGTRLQDFTTGSWALLGRAPMIQLNAAVHDATKHGALPLVADAGEGLVALDDAIGADWRTPEAWRTRVADEKARWDGLARAATAASNAELPSDAQVIGAVQAAAPSDAVLVCAAGGLPGELHKLWRVPVGGGYHLEYGYSTMGYEIAGGLGVKMADPARPVIVMVGDGSYLMMNSEIATSVMLGLPLLIVLLDNGGFGCIDRLQRATGGASFNNRLADARHATLPALDFAAHAASLGATAETVTGLAGLSAAVARAAGADRTHVVVIRTDPALSTDAGGAWWDVAVPEVSPRAEVRAARAGYEAARANQHLS